MGVPIPPPPPLNILSLCLYAGFTRAEPGATGLQSVFASTVNVGADRPDSRKGARQKLALASPNFGFYYLLCELLGATDDDSDYVYLSDGGHFDLAQALRFGIAD